MVVAECQNRLLTLERFALISFTDKRERSEKFVAGLKLSIQLLVPTFAYATLMEVIIRALEVENTHE